MSLTVEHGERGAIAAAGLPLRIWRYCSRFEI
jgi:hypothetical protein